MKLKELHALMQDIEPFASPKPALEQYPTGPDIASRMLYTIESAYNDFEGKLVVDLGTGTGMLAIGAALLGAPAVLGVDVDPEALQVAQANVDAFDDPLPIDFVLADVAQLAAAGFACGLQADTVLMNPPFGTKAKGADMQFLRAAAALQPAAIYSLHKSSTRVHIHKVATRELGCCGAQVLAELRYNLPATMRFHRQREVDIAVDLWRFQLPRPAAAQQRRRGGSAHAGAVAAAAAAAAPRQRAEEPLGSSSGGSQHSDSSSSGGGGDG